MPNMVGKNLWVLPTEGYGLWVTADLWVIVRNSPQTKSVYGSSYGLRGVMGYEGYGLRGVRLYSKHAE